MSILPDFSRQYQPPKIPTHWSADERRFAQGVTDVLDDIYLRYGRMSKKDLSPTLSKEISDASGNIVQLQLDTSGLTTRMLSAEGNLSTLQLTADGLLSRVQGVENTNTTQQTEINQNKLDITLKASETAVTALDGRLTTAESSISIQAGQIALKAEKTVTDGLNTRLISAEEKITPNAITATVRSHADYQSDLSAKNRTFVGGTPTGMIAGDLWIDSANGNLLKRYNGSAWAAVQDGAISIAQQQADKIQWLVASGTSAANMTLTSQLYSLMAANIDLSANNSIKLAVSGGTNLLTGTDFEQGWTGWMANSGTTTISDGSAFYTYIGKNMLVSVAASSGFNGVYRTYTSFIVGVPYTISGYFRTAASGWVLSCSADTSVSREITTTLTFAKYELTFIPTATSGIIYLLNPDGSRNIYVDNFKLEKGTMATDWSPSPSDPASGVKTSKVTIDGTGIAMTTGGTFTTTSQNFSIDAAGNVTMKGTIIATSGTIGGITIRSNALSIGKTSVSDLSAGMWLDSTGLSLGDLRISESGYFFNNYFTFKAPNNGNNVTLALNTNVLGTGTSDGSMLYSFHDYSASMNSVDGKVAMKVPNVTAAKLFVTYRYYTTNQSTTMYVSSDLYCDYNCSALSFTDRTPAYTGNALDELRWVRGNRAQGIDHNSIPPFARKTIENTRTLPDGTVEHYHEPGRDLGAMISILTKAVQEIDDRMNAFERRLPA